MEQHARWVSRPLLSWQRPWTNVGYTRLTLWLCVCGFFRRGPEVSSASVVLVSRGLTVMSGRTSVTAGPAWTGASATCCWTDSFANARPNFLVNCVRWVSFLMDQCHFSIEKDTLLLVAYWKSVHPVRLWVQIHCQVIRKSPKIGPDASLTLNIRDPCVFGVLLAFFLMALKYKENWN